MISSSSSESMGFPTQKPEALLRRVIGASSNAGDAVFDPFAGSGTSVTAAEAMGRRWIAIDSSYLSLALVKHRLLRRFGESVSPHEIFGDPKDMERAQVLAREDIHGFRWWALSLVGAPRTKRLRRPPGVFTGTSRPRIRRLETPAYCRDGARFPRPFPDNGTDTVHLETG